MTGMIKNFNFILLIVSTSVSIYGAKLYADTIYLKNGRNIEGIIKNEDTDTVELEVCSGSVKFKNTEIVKIEKSSSEEFSAIRDKWERQKIETQGRILKQQLQEEQKPREVEFSRDSQSIMLGVTLNKKVQARLILDTGATLVILGKNMAEKLGINLNNVSPDAKLTLADGRKVNAKFIILESIEAQGAEAKRVEAAIMLDEVKDASFQDGLLGMSFLKRFNFKVDYKEKKLTLEKL